MGTLTKGTRRRGRRSAGTAEASSAADARYRRAERRRPAPAWGRAEAVALLASAIALIASTFFGATAQAAGAAPADQLILSHGHAQRMTNRFLPAGPLAPSAPPSLGAIKDRGPVANLAAGHTARSAGPSVAGVLSALARSGALSAQGQQQYLSEYQHARRTVARLSGTRRGELSAVLTNVQSIAAAGQLTASRLAALFLTVQRNEQWWSSGPLLAGGQRVGFPGSGLVWQYYPGQGIEIQWLGTFGEANGYYSAGDNFDLRRVLDEAVALASSRAGGIAWEYLFRFDGGSPPWTSGLSQGTAIQSLARAWSRLHVPAYQSAARAALGIFQAPPPQGVRVATAAGAHYLEYSYAPRERILNGLIQALVGLYDYTHLTGDPLGEQLFEAGDAEARVETPSFDTGAWSLYDQSSESDLSYHQLVIQFLQNLCARTQKSPTPLGAPAPGNAVANPDQVYCATAAHFQSDLTTKPVITLASPSHPVGGRGGALRYRLSKISTVSVTVRRGSTLVYFGRAVIPHGLHTSGFTPAARAGVYTVTVAATDLAGNGAAVSGALSVSAPPHARR